MGALLAALALTAAGCGGSTSEGGSASDAAPREGKKGGKVTFPAAADVDYLDPGQTYYTFGYTVAYATNRPLYSFEPDDAETPVPDLAEGEPLISADNRTITVKLRPGVRFSPPVNREVTAADVKYAFERAFTRNVPSGYATSYFADITGAPDAPGAFRSIAGIKAPDDRTRQPRARVHARGEGGGRAGLRRRALHGPGGSAHGRRQRRSRAADRDGRPGPARAAGLRAQLPQGAAGHVVHALLQRAGLGLRDLPQRRLVP